jgi:hypothetical protein
LGKFSINVTRRHCRWLTSDSSATQVTQYDHNWLNPTKLDEYALRLAAPKSLFVREMEYFGKLQINTRKIERLPLVQSDKAQTTKASSWNFSHPQRKILTSQQNIHRRIKKRRKGWIRSNTTRLVFSPFSFKCYCPLIHFWMDFH